MPVLFDNGKTSAAIVINITDDHLVERREQFSAHIISGGGNQNLNIFSPNATVYITSNDGR